MSVKTRLANPIVLGVFAASIGLAATSAPAMIVLAPATLTVGQGADQGLLINASTTSGDTIDSADVSPFVAPLAPGGLAAPISNIDFQTGTILANGTTKVVDNSPYFPEYTYTGANNVIAKWPCFHAEIQHLGTGDRIDFHGQSFRQPGSDILQSRLDAAKHDRHIVRCHGRARARVAVTRRHCRVRRVAPSLTEVDAITRAAHR